MSAFHNFDMIGVVDRRTALIAVIAIQCVIGSADDEVPIVTTVCELTANPKKFNGRLVQVRAQVVAGVHASGLTEASCRGFIVFGGDTEQERNSPRWRGQIACGNGSSIERLLKADYLNWEDAAPAPPPVAHIESESSSQLANALGDRHEKDGNCMRRKVTATIDGRFDHEACAYLWVRAYPDAQPRELGPTGYGNARAFRSRLVVRSVRDVETGEINACWDQAEKSGQSPAAR